MVSIFHRGELDRLFERADVVVAALPAFVEGVQVLQIYTVIKTPPCRRLEAPVVMQGEGG